MFLYGTEFELYTVHKPLATIYSSRSKPCARIERWVLRLQPYKFKVKYLPGGQNIADPLSHFSQTKGPAKTPSPHEIPDDFVKFLAVTATPKAMTRREIEEASAEDEEFIESRGCINKGNRKGDKLKQYLLVSGELYVIWKLALRATRILALVHEGHPGIVSM